MSTKISKRATFYLLLLVVLLAATLHQFTKTHDDNRTAGRQNRSPLVFETTESLEPVEVPNTLSSGEDNGRSIPMDMDYDEHWCFGGQLSKQGQQIYESKLIEWRKKLGQFSEYEKASYASYDIETLRSLGKQGDLLALNVLYDRLLVSEDTYEDAMKALELSVAFGSSRASILAATHFRLNNRKERIQTGGSPEPTDEELFQILAYYEIAAMRGDVAGLLEGWQLLASLDRKLSAADAREVSRIANDTLQELRARNNVSPEIVESSVGEDSKAIARFQKHHSRKFGSSPKETGWGGDYIEKDTCLANASWYSE